MSMEHSYIHLEDLPDEILLIIFRELRNCDVLYSFMGLNKRFDTILNDRIFTTNLTLMQSTHSSSYQLKDMILDRFCLEILPKINDKIRQFNIESSFMERILLATDYPYLHALSLYNFVPEAAGEVFHDSSYLIRRFQKQISSFSIRLKPHKHRMDLFNHSVSYDRRYPFDQSISKKNAGIFSTIRTAFKNLQYLNFSSSSDFEQLTFSHIDSTKYCSNLLELHVVVRTFSDFLALLNSQMHQLHTFYVTIRPHRTGENDYMFATQAKVLINLKCFSLIHENKMTLYDDVVVPLLQRMTNLQELNLYFDNIYGPLIDGNELQNNIIDHMSRLNKFTFNIISLVDLDDRCDVPSSEAIKNSFRNFFANTQIISSVYYLPERNLLDCHVYSYPYQWTSYYNITNHFTGGLFKSVRQISLRDNRPFEHDFLLRIAQSFPLITTFILQNYQPQENNQIQWPIIRYSHLIEIDLAEAHEDYVEEFLNSTKMCLLDNVCLRLRYNLLKKVTADFTRDTTRINCSKIKILCLIPSRYTVDYSKLKDYFPFAQFS